MPNELRDDLGKAETVKLGANWVQSAPSLHPKVRGILMYTPRSLSRKDERHDSGLGTLFGGRDRLGVDVQGRSNRRVPE